MAMDRVKVIGLQRSGTNYVDGLIKRNFEPVVFVSHQVLWKHEFVENLGSDFPPESIVVLVHKSPYSWMESLQRSAKDLWKYHDLAGPGPQIKIRRGHYEGMQLTVSVERLCDLYSRYHLGWLRSSLRTVPVALESVIADVHGVVGRLEEAGLRRIEQSELELDFEVNQARPLSASDRARLADPTSFDLDSETLATIDPFVDPAVWDALDHPRLG